MKNKFRLAVIWASVFMCVNLAAAQTQKRPSGAGAIISTFKVGQWLKIQGLPQADQSVSVGKIKLVTGDFKDTDWQVFGPARALDKEKKEFMILSLRIKAAEDAEYGTNALNVEVKSFADLKPGMLIEAEGTFLKDGTFLATDIKDETASTDAEDADEVEFFGKIEKIDTLKRTLTILGVTFHITDATKLKTALK